MTQQYIDPFGPRWQFRHFRLLFCRWQGSIFQFLLIDWAVATLLAALFLLLWYDIYDKRDVTEIVSEVEGVLVATDTLFNRFQAALSLMLGFYTSTIYGRWWAVRYAEGTAMGRINDLSIQIAAQVRDDEASSGYSANEVRLTLVRWLNLSHSLAVGELYEKKPNEFSSLEGLRDMGLMTEREYEYLEKNVTSRYAAPFVWFMQLVSALHDKNNACGISANEVYILGANVSTIRGSLADLYLYRNVPLPLSYRQLANFAVRIYMICVMILGGLDALEIMDGAYDTQVFWLLLPFAFEYFLFVGWLSAADALGNPFRTWADELEWDNYVRSIGVSSNLFVTASCEVQPLGLEELLTPTKTLEPKWQHVLAQWFALLNPQ